MSEIEKLDNKLYKALYVLPKMGDVGIIWKKIKSNPKILREAIITNGKSHPKILQKVRKYIL